MVAGFDRYFQIAPCFRDEDARADRSPGEFYQLDFEMSFVNQDDVFAALEPVLHGVFEEFAAGRTVAPAPFPRIPFAEAMATYGTDKPDLRNPLIISDVTEAFRGSSFGLFAKGIEGGSVVKAIPAPGTGGNPRSFFDKLNDWARGEGAGGLGYIIYEPDGSGKGPIAKNIDEARLQQIAETTGAAPGDAVFFACDKPDAAAEFAGTVRTKLGEDLDLIEKDVFKFCWIVDFPMFELDEATGKIEFSHNPFSMPQGGMEALETMDPLDIKAWQYDIVCNGVELSSGAIRNHLPEIMYKAFGIAGYGRGGRRGPLRRHAERAQVRRAAPWRLGPGHRPHRHAAGRRAEHPRGRGLPDEPAGRGPDDAGPGRDRARTPARAQHPRPHAAQEGGRRESVARAL